MSQCIAHAPHQSLFLVLWPLYLDHSPHFLFLPFVTALCDGCFLMGSKYPSWHSIFVQAKAQYATGVLLSLLMVCSIVWSTGIWLNGFLSLLWTASSPKSIFLIHIRVCSMKLQHIPQRDSEISGVVTMASRAASFPGKTYGDSKLQFYMSR